MRLRVKTLHGCAMLEKLRKMIKDALYQPVSPRYCIVFDKRYGFAAFHKEYSTWYCVKADGTTGVDMERCKDPFFGAGVWVKTEAEAGARINFHADDAGQRIIWKGGE